MPLVFLEWVIQIVETSVPLALGASRWGQGQLGALPSQLQQPLLFIPMCRADFLLFSVLHDLEKVRKYCCVSE